MPDTQVQQEKQQSSKVDVGQKKGSESAVPAGQNKGGLGQGALAAAVASGESDNCGGYDAFNVTQGKKCNYSSKEGDLIEGKKLTTYSLGEMLDLSKRSSLSITHADGKKESFGGKLWAAGRYQVTAETLHGKMYTGDGFGIRHGMKEFGPSTIFNQDTQDKCFDYICNKSRKPIHNYLYGNGDIDAAAKSVAQVWASVGVKGTNKSYYAGDGVNAENAHTSYETIIAALKADKAAIERGEMPVATSQASAQEDKKTATKSTKTEATEKTNMLPEVVVIGKKSSGGNTTKSNGGDSATKELEINAEGHPIYYPKGVQDTIDRINWNKDRNYTQAYIKSLQKLVETEDDGEFGTNTVNAIRHYQEKNSLPSKDGKWGKECADASGLVRQYNSGSSTTKPKGGSATFNDKLENNEEAIAMGKTAAETAQTLRDKYNVPYTGKRQLVRSTTESDWRERKYVGEYMQERRSDESAYYDCSAFTSRCWASAGVSLHNDTAAGQGSRLNKIGALSTDFSQVQAGDLLFYRPSKKDNGRFERINHIAIAISNNEKVDAGGTPVRKEGFGNPYCFGRPGLLK